jgi:hypothetical protein
MSNKKNRKLRSTLPTVVCECGKEILVVPDLLEMERCINEHAATHTKGEPDSAKAHIEFDRIEDILTQKVLIMIAQGFL